MDIFALIAEDKIRTAQKNGEFDHLPGKGKPLKLEDLSGIPEHLRMGYKMLKNAGMLTDEKELNKEILGLNDLIAACVDPKERAGLKRQLNEKLMRYNQLLEKKDITQNPAYKQYRNKIDNKLFK
ncbi:MAG: DUF1992 domain-containing protein [Tuberibacillus sp.]